MRRIAARRLVPQLAAVAALALLAGLAATARAANASVEIVDMAFTPAAVTVNVGETVTWTNTDPMVHTVTSTTGAFDSGDLGEGESYSVTFDAPGTYSYLCTPHPFMTGTVTVVAAAVAPAPSPSGGIPNVALPAPGSTLNVALVLAGLVLLATAVALLVRRGVALALARERGTKRVD